MTSDIHESNAENAESVAASRTGRWIRLVPLQSHHHEFLYELATNEEFGYRWRFGGAVPTLEVFEQNLWANVLAQFTVVERRSGSLIGMVVAYNADLTQGHVYVGGVMTSGVQRTGLGIEAFHVFSRYLFGTWNLRKLYFDVPEYNVEFLASGIGNILKEEGRFRQHTYYGGRYWDRFVFALYRDDIEVLGQRPMGRRRGRAQE